MQHTIKTLGDLRALVTSLTQPDNTPVYNTDSEGDFTTLEVVTGTTNVIIFGEKEDDEEDDEENTKS